MLHPIFVWEKIMFSLRSRPMLLRAGFIPCIHRNRYSTQKTTIQTKSLRTAATGLAIGLPAGFAAHKSGKESPEVSNTKSSNGFYQGSSIWKGHAVEPFTLDDVGVWLRKEESSHLVPSGIGVQSWYSLRCASNSPCEDNYVAAQVPVSGNGGSQPWLFWGVFDGHK
jgi:pyruvate dehydrogenase phosphatase